MFFSTQLLSKKGPLATVWLAGHMDKRLKKAQIIDTSISNSVGEAALHCHEALLSKEARFLRRCRVQGCPAPVSRHALLGADNIINSEAPLALRLSGQLLLGVVRIHARKVVFLYNDCNEAVVRLKQVSIPVSRLQTGRAQLRFQVGCSFLQPSSPVTHRHHCCKKLNAVSERVTSPTQ